MGLSKLSFTCPLERFEGFNFTKLLSFFFSCGHWAKKFLYFVNNISTELSKLHSKYQWGNNGVNLFNWSTVLLILFGNWAKSLGLLTKVLWRSFENYILRVHQDNLRALFQKKIIFHHFWTVSDKIRPLSQKVSNGLSKLHSTCPQEQFERIF